MHRNSFSTLPLAIIWSPLLSLPSPFVSSKTFIMPLGWCFVKPSTVWPAIWALNSLKLESLNFSLRHWPFFKGRKQNSMFVVGVCGIDVNRLSMHESLRLQQEFSVIRPIQTCDSDHTAWMTSVDILDWYKPLIPKDCPSFWVVLWPGKQKDSTTHNKNLIGTNFKVSTCPASGVIKTTLCRTPPAVDAINGQPTNFCNPWRDYNNTYVCNWRKYISCVLPNRKSSIFSCSKQTIIRVGDLIQISYSDDALRRLHPGLNRNRKQATCECTGEPIDSVHWFVIDGKQMKNRPFSLVHSPSFDALDHALSRLANSHVLCITTSISHLRENDPIFKYFQRSEQKGNRR